MALDIASIKTQLSGATVLELKQLIDELKEEWGVTAAAPVMAGPAVAAAAAPAVEEPTEFNVVLISAGEKKLDVIKEVRAITGLGLKEAKDLAEAGGNVKESLPKDEANKIKEQLEKAGAKVELKAS
ncbi:MAG: 50S ribosomal protein L7/L12 [Meiothermus sp.]|nr:50S ribosomal protein L7/L12 [Meiothermus sp.]